MIVQISRNFFMVVFVMIFASIDLWLLYPGSPFLAIVMTMFTIGYLLHEPAHAIIANLLGSKQVIMNLGGFSDNYVDFESISPAKDTIVKGAGAAIQTVQCGGTVILAIITEWQTVTFIPTIIAICFMTLFLMDFRIPHSDISQVMLWFNQKQEA